LQRKKGQCLWESFTVHAAGLTAVGKVRAINEDSFWLEMDVPVFCVADGAGGYDSGDVASQLTIKAFDSMFFHGDPDADTTLPIGLQVGGTPDLMTRAIELANGIIYQKSLTQKMASTVVSLCLHDGEAHISHVGDSRAYLFRDGGLQQLTGDHSLVMELFECGAITREEMAKHPKRNVITRAIGGAAEVQVDTLQLPVQKNDLFFLCSDGLSGMVDDQVLAEGFRSVGGDVEPLAEKMLELALAGGGRDNITVIVVGIMG
jgi:serine/threonine protein phosphatase PrpC